jgi:anthranilate phosphoribosyltransferase
MSSLDWDAAISKMESGLDLTPDEAQYFMKEVLEDRSEKEVLKKFLMALKNKSETPEEVGALVKQMYQYCAPISILERAVDTVGTGGDGAEMVGGAG